LAFEIPKLWKKDQRKVTVLLNENNTCFNCFPNVTNARDSQDCSILQVLENVRQEKHKDSAAS